MKVSSFRFQATLQRDLLAILAVLIAATSISAQTGRMVGSARRIEEFNKQADKAFRDDKTGDLNSRKPTAEERKGAKAAQLEIEESLSAIQAGYNELVIKLQSRESLTAQFIAESTGEINKNAERLRANIKFPEIKEEANQTGHGPQSLVPHRKQLIELCTQILAFFDSPFFENPNVLDVAKANEARKILDVIIARSSELKNINE